MPIRKGHPVDKEELREYGRELAKLALKSPQHFVSAYRVAERTHEECAIGWSEEIEAALVAYEAEAMKGF